VIVDVYIAPGVVRDEKGHGYPRRVFQERLRTRADVVLEGPLLFEVGKRRLQLPHRAGDGQGGCGHAELGYFGLATKR
jgi:hypothetical protein